MWHFLTNCKGFSFLLIASAGVSELTWIAVLFKRKADNYYNNTINHHSAWVYPVQFGNIPPVPSCDKRGGLGMGQTTPSHKKSNVTETNVRETIIALTGMLLARGLVRWRMSTKPCRELTPRLWIPWNRKWILEYQQTYLSGKGV